MSEKISIIFFGTHHFATTILQGLINEPLFDVQLVITQPDKPVGREQELQKSPVKLLAEKYSINILQPVSLKNIEYSKDINLGKTLLIGTPDEIPDSAHIIKIIEFPDGKTAFKIVET